MSSLVTLGLAGCANAFVLTGFSMPFLVPAVGFCFLLVQPVWLLYNTSFWDRLPRMERLGYSLAAILLFLMAAGLAMNAVLPHLGLARPLDPVPVLVMLDVLTVAAYYARRRYPAQRVSSSPASARAPEGIRLVVAAALPVVLAVLGANRLNNGAGDQVSLAALIIDAIVLIFLLRWHSRIREEFTAATLYLVSLSLLLMTSLRGWYITGHDIQTEYQVFQLTLAHGRWNIALFRNAYNACLSITILPTEFAHLVHVADPYIYKVFFQLIFAASTPLVYTIARRYWQAPVAILASIYFISFPTFFTDMPFLNRQEIAIVFLCAGLLAITNHAWSPQRRRLTFLIIAVGVEVSHYSTMYQLLAVTLVSWLAHWIWKALRRPRPARASHARPQQWGSIDQILGAWSVLAVFLICFAWGYLATQTAGALVTDARAAVTGLFSQTGHRSENVSYTVLFFHKPTPQQIVNEYQNAAFKIRAKAPRDAYLPSGDLSYSRLRADPEPSLPLTAAGRVLSDIGVPVAVLNGAIRIIAAEGEQIFIGIGLLACLFMPALRRQIGREFLFLGIGCAAFLVIITVLPGLSVDYGVLRAFEESLIFLGPVLVSGCMTMFHRLGTIWSSRLTSVLCLGIFISTTGLLPQVLGGYPAQLSLNNSGQYYDSYYTHPQEVSAVNWLSHQQGVLPGSLQATFSPDRYLFTQPSDVTGGQFISDAFPPLLRPTGWVILGYAVVRYDRAALSYSGDLNFYSYPMSFIRNSKNLVYDNGGAEVYR